MEKGARVQVIDKALPTFARIGTLIHVDGWKHVVLLDELPPPPPDVGTFSISLVLKEQQIRELFMGENFRPEVHYYAVRFTMTGLNSMLKEGYEKVTSASDMETFAKKLMVEGFRSKNAGHDWWIFPGALLSLVELDSRGKQKMQ